MVLSCVRLTIWFCKLYGAASNLLLLTSIIQRNAYNISSHLLKALNQVVLAKLRKPPDILRWLVLSALSLNRTPSSFNDYVIAINELFDDEKGERRNPSLCYRSQLASTDITNFTSHFDPVEMYRLASSFNILPSSRISYETPIIAAKDLQTALDPIIQAIERNHIVLDSLPSFALSYNILTPGYEQVLKFSDQDNDMPIVIDTGASRSLSPNKDDFVSYTPLDSTIKGVGTTSRILGVGKVRWKITDMNNRDHTIETQAYHVPEASIRLYSPQFHFRECMRGELVATCDGISLKIPTGKTGFRQLEFPYQASSNLPMMLPSSHPSLHRALYSPASEQSFFNAFETNLPKFNPIYESVDIEVSREEFAALVDESNSNLSRSQKELLVWHWRLGHVDMNRIKTLMHPSKPLDSLESRGNLNPPVVIETKNTKTHLCEVPKCQACIFAKMTKTKTGAKHIKGDKFMALSRNTLLPGDAVSVDQYIVSQKGRLLTSFGREGPNSSYSGGTIYVDHASGKVHLQHQVSLRAGETLLGKRAFEREAHAAGFKVKKYHGDNGIFTSDAWRDDCLVKEQELDLSGVGAHHQNGKAERAIRTITSLARAMMIHSALHWPEAHNLSHWPMAMDHAVYLWNNLPASDGLSAEEKFTRQKFPNYDHLRRAHVWGAPTYVLDPKLQDGNKIPKFSPRSRQGKFLGYSRNHSSSVALVLNRQTGKISPQFHCLFDDFFQTVRGVNDLNEIKLDEIDWDAFINTVGTDQFYDEDDEPLPPLQDESWMPKQPNIIPQRPQPKPLVTIPPSLTNEVPKGSTPTPRSPEIPTLPTPLVKREKRITEEPKPSPEIIVIDSDDEASEEPNLLSDTNSSPQVPPTPIDAARDTVSERLGRGHRQRRPNTRIFNDDFIPGAFYTPDIAEFCGRQKFSLSALTDFALSELDWKDSFATLAQSGTNGDSKRYFGNMDILQNPFNNDLDSFPTLALQAQKSASSADNPRWHEAMRGPHADGFMKANILEISTLQELKTWTQVPRRSNLNVLDSTWAFKIKRFPDGLVRKLKSRFCVRGDQQIEGVDFFDTFAPVVQWSTVRLLLVLSLTLGLATKQVDYVSAFCQAPIDEDVYVELPKGWQKLNQMGGLKEKFKADHVLKLNRSCYGLRQSPKNFFQLLKSNLEKCGFQQSTLDPCLFISPTVICVCYVDDCLFYSKHEPEIDKAIDQIKKCGMDLQVEDSVAGFLGVHIDRVTQFDKKEGKELEYIRLLQTGLIDRIIKALDLESHTSGCKTPAPLDPLPRDLEGEPFDHRFNYASIVGMCMYLCNNSRPDITFAVNQCSRHSHKPTQKHADYLIRLGRYLKATRDQGLIFRPESSLKIDCYVDADFAGLYNFEDNQDPHCVKSRTGYVIFVGGCPIIWSSKLQKEIAVSTMESEYIACSTSCRDLLPLMDLVCEIAGAVGLPIEKKSDLHTTLWEDNIGALTLCQLELPRMTPRSKHIAVKYHWFREHVQSGRIAVKKIDSKDQIADLFTKGLGPSLFLELRRRLVGW